MSRTTAVRIKPAWPDPEEVHTAIRRAGPFWPLANYAANDAEMSALGSGRVTFIPPWFRQNFAAAGSPLVDGAGAMLANPPFVDAARSMAGPDAVVVPTDVYVNIMGPTPFSFPPHLDVPAFRGVTRTDYPIWLLKVMKTSGLFERWRTTIATAVTWFYDGPGGDFHYWPGGPDGPEGVESPPFDNVAVVADNEATFHGVAPLGPNGARMPESLTSESRLVRGESGWNVQDANGTILAHFDDAEVRVTVSWKAYVYADDDAARRADSDQDQLDLATVVDTLRGDLRRRGVDVPRPEDPLADEEWTATLAATYRDPVLTI